MDTPGFSPAAAQPSPAGALDGHAAPIAATHRLAIRFTGSGSEYFRIWIVNLLLMLVTLSVYYPWAKARRLRYFYGNTLVGGHPLGFHGSPRAMLRGYLLGVLLFGAYSATNKAPSFIGALAGLLIVALWPALLQSSMRFRLANTGWRGLRLRFRGTVGGAYGALLPPYLAVIAVFAVVGFMAAIGQPVAGVLVALFGMALLPWAAFRVKRYQHDHYAFGDEQALLTVGPKPFYGLFLRASGVAFAGLLVASAVGAGALALVVYLRGDAQLQLPAALTLLPAVLAAVLLLAMQVLLRPYLVSRMQNLVWSNTASASVRFTSTLRLRPLIGLTLRNWLFILLTLGLYWPFAAIAVQRLRVESVGAELSTDPDTFADRQRAAPGGAAGDAANDLLGVDVGL